MRTFIEKLTSRILLAGLLSVALNSSPCEAHDGPVHEKITASAAALSDGLSSFLAENNATLNSPKFTAASESPESLTAVGWLSHSMRHSTWLYHRTAPRSLCPTQETTEFSSLERRMGGSLRPSDGRAAGQGNSPRQKAWCMMESATSTSLIPGTTASSSPTGRTFLAPAVPTEARWGNSKAP